MHHAIASARHAISARGSLVALCAAFLLAVACRDNTAPRPPALLIAAGDGQRGLVGTELPAFVVIELRDAAQRPLAGVRVTWAAAAGASDVITPEAPATDGAGRVRARWKLDATPGTHLLLVTAAGAATVRVTAYADVQSTWDLHPLPMSTYDGSGQMVHPDFVRLPTAWSGDPLRLVATPYPGGNAHFENPSLYTGSTGTIWDVPSGVQNPLVRPVAGYLSDPDVVFDPDAQELRIYYRRVTNENEIWMIHSADGIHWSPPVLTAHASNHMIISPSIVRRSPSEWLMWSVNGGTAGCGGASTSVELRRSVDGVSWSSPERVTLSDPDGFAWHIEVEWIPSRSEYWALYPVKKAGSCRTDRLRLATSTDGLQWRSYPSPVLRSGVSEQLKDIVYRSSLEYDATSATVVLWYSGAMLDHGRYAWHLAWERVTLATLLARVNAPLMALAPASVLPTPNAPPLTNETAP
jgi:hypothetical protein